MAHPSPHTHLAAQVKQALAPELDTLETRRRALHRNGYMALVVAFIVAALGSVLSISAGLTSVWVFLLVGFGPIFLGWVAKDLQARNWAQTVSQRVIPRLTAPLGEDIRHLYDASSRFQMRDIKSAPLFPKFQTSTAKHLITGSHRDVGYELASVKLLRAEGRRTVVAWEGLVIRIAVPLPAPGLIWLGHDYPGAMQKNIGLFKATPVMLSHVPLTHPIGLDVYASDPQAAASYLPNRFFDVLKDIATQEGAGPSAMRMVFDGDMAWLSLEGDHDFLAAVSINVPMSDLEERLPHMIKDLTLPHRIIDRLAGDDV